MVGGRDDAFRFHPFDNPSGAVVADLKVALHKARRSLAFAAHHRDGLRIQLIARSTLLVLRKWIKRRTVIFGDFVDIVRRAAGFQERHHTLDFFVRYEWAVDACDAAAAGHVEHIATAEQLLGAALPKDRATVDLRGHLKAD